MNLATVDDPNGAIKKGGFDKLAHVGWSSASNTVYLMFTGGKADVPVTGNGAVRGSVWWDPSVTKTKPGCEDIAADAFVQAGFETLSSGDPQHGPKQAPCRA